MQQPSETADVVVIGGGPAGSAVALRLARRGWQVIQLERRVFLDPRNDRLRSGEGLIPRARRELAQLECALHPADWVLSTVAEVRIAWPGGVQTANPIAARGGIVQIDREVFDHDLFRAARRAGVDGREGWRVRALARTSGGAIAGVLALAPGEQTVSHIRAPVVVDAGGRNAPALRELHARAPLAGDSFFGMAMFFDQVRGLEPGVWEMHLLDLQALAVVQLSQIEPGAVRCGLGFVAPPRHGRHPTPPDMFWARIRQCPDLARRFEGSRAVDRPFVRSPIGYRVPRVAFDGLVLAGDAAGYLNPLFGDGILRALGSARLAADEVAAALRHGDCSAASFARYARLHAWRDRADQALHQLLLGTRRFPAATSYLGRARLVRAALFAALLRA
jgi:flavin-dependent dehydrogenase